MADLEKATQMMEEIILREVTRMYESNESLDEKSAKTAELLGKCLDLCYERRGKVPPPDPFASISTSELEQDFE